jgi:hypothetical protein
MDNKCDLVEVLRKQLSKNFTEEQWKTDDWKPFRALKVLFFRLHQVAKLTAPETDPWGQMALQRSMRTGQERSFQYLIQSLPEKFYITLFQQPLEAIMSISLDDWEDSIVEAEAFCSSHFTPPVCQKVDIITCSTAVPNRLDAAVSNMVSELCLEEEILSLMKMLKISPRNIGETCTYTWKRDLATGCSYSSRTQSDPQRNLYCNLGVFRWDPEDGRMKMVLATKGLLPLWLEKLVLSYVVLSHKAAQWVPCEQRKEPEQQQKTYFKPQKKSPNSGGYSGPRPSRRY